MTRVTIATSRLPKNPTDSACAPVEGALRLLLTDDPDATGVAGVAPPDAASVRLRWEDVEPDRIKIFGKAKPSKGNTRSRREIEGGPGSGEGKELLVEYTKLLFDVAHKEQASDFRLLSEILHDEVDRVGNFETFTGDAERRQDGRDLPLRELNVDGRTRDLNHLADG